ncbi:MAG: LamG domain-containing protein [Opitutaceae bacterium]|jgi:hypothetical protein|nr:LamG domain-containing protein [Opitutaceae bacterium]
MKIRLLSATLAIATLFAFSLRLESAAENTGMPLRLRYDFAGADGQSVPDVSGHGRNGVVAGKARVAPAPDAIAPRRNALDNTTAVMGSATGGTGGGVRYAGPAWGPQKAFTVTMWFRTNPGQPLAQGTRLWELHGIAPGVLLLGISQGRLTVNLGEKSILTHTTPRPLLQETGKWVFVAFSCDGTYERDNLRLFIGSETDPIQTIAIATTAEPLWAEPAGRIELVAGSNIANGRALAGWLDDIRVYGHANDTTGALLLPECQTVLDERVNPSVK